MHGQSTTKKPANQTLDPSLSFGINPPEAAEAGLRRAVADAKARAWQRENADTLASSNAWTEAHGLPLDQYRQF